AIGQLATLRRPALDRAFVAWREQPTAETRTALDHERRLNELQRWAVSGALFLSLSSITLIVFWRRAKKQHFSRQVAVV
ncbi:MAG: hypothetical protein ACK4UN_01355, partial [Limisphaerales bacterium]